MIRIACTALGKRILAGKVSKDGRDFVGEPQDVTSDCIKAVIEKVGVGGMTVVKVGGVDKYSITVFDISDQTPTPASKFGEEVPDTTEKP